jgi:hypothetical protein
MQSPISRLTCQLLATIASWLCQVELMHFARTCRVGRTAMKSPIAHNTLDLRHYYVIERNTPRWCQVLLRMPTTEFWRNICFPPIGERTFTFSALTKGADKVIVRLLERVEMVHDLWCSQALLDLICEQGRQASPRLYRISIITILDLTEDQPVPDPADFLLKLRCWTRQCPHLLHASVRYYLDRLYTVPLDNTDDVDPLLWPNTQLGSPNKEPDALPLQPLAPLPLQRQRSANSNSCSCCIVQ